MIANIIYVATFAPVVYWIFLSNYFRWGTADKAHFINKIPVDVHNTQVP